MLRVFRIFSLFTFLWLAGPALAQQVIPPATAPFAQPAPPVAPAATAPVPETTSSDRREGSNNQKDWHFIGHVEMEDEDRGHARVNPFLQIARPAGEVRMILSRHLRLPVETLPLLTLQ